MLRTLLPWLVALAFGFVVAGSAHAMSNTDQRTFLLRIYNAKAPKDRWFAKPFLKQVPPARLAELLASMRSKYGPGVRVSGQHGQFTIWTKRYRIRTVLYLDHEDRVSTLLFKQFSVRAQTLEKLALTLNHYQSSYLLLENGRVQISKSEDQALAVGSAFKLAVLVALKRKIDAGEINWTDVVTLAARHRSLPSGQLQRFPSGAPLTVHTLAALMISISDNTATDALIDLVGLQAVEKITGIRPFLTTRQFFQLIDNPETYRAYAAADVAGRRQVLKALDGRALPPVSRINRPYAKHKRAEWHLSASTICRWLEELQELVGPLDVMAINPGLAAPKDWSRIAYKGGSEIGVLTFATWFVAKAGQRYCFVATWNGPGALDTSMLASHYTAVIDFLAERSGQ